MLAVFPTTSQALEGEAARPTIERGIVQDWDALQLVWKRAWACAGTGGASVDPKEQPCLFLETPLAPKAQRERITQLAFER